MRKLYLAMGLALVAMFVAAGTVFAAVTFDPDTGTGFVGKGDVQLFAGWNNKQLQDNAKFVQFRASTTSTTTWTCTKEHPSGDPDKDIVQARNTEITTQGIVTTITREQSKGKDGPVTGFKLEGYFGTPTTTTDGPAVGSCPADQSGFVYDNNAQTTPGTTQLQISIDSGATWANFPS